MKITIRKLCKVSKAKKFFFIFKSELYVRNLIRLFPLKTPHSTTEPFKFFVILKISYWYMNFNLEGSECQIKLFSLTNFYS